MLNIIWPFFIIISFIFAIMTNNMGNLNNSIFQSCDEAVQLSITLLGTMCLWNGLMKIVKETNLINKLSNILYPIIHILFPNLKKEDKEYKEISINIIANLLGIGNAATPSGLQAMKTMQEKNSNKERLTDNMAMFIILNTASIQLIPTTVIAIRMSLNSAEPTKVIFPIWIATISADIAGIIASKILSKKF